MRCRKKRIINVSVSGLPYAMETHWGLLVGLYSELNTKQVQKYSFANSRMSVKLTLLI